MYSTKSKHNEGDVLIYFNNDYGENNGPLNKSTKQSSKKNKKTQPLLKLRYSDTNLFEIGVDEAGRGPMFGRLYVAAVILPRDENLIDITDIRDSKKLSAKKRKEMSDYIKEKCISYHIQFIEPNVIDKINIRESVLKGMKECILKVRTSVLSKIDTTNKINYENEIFTLIDGDDFTPLMCYEEVNDSYFEIPHTTVIGGDNKYASVAAASILAKVARDEYIEKLCLAKPKLVEMYGIDTNMGYGTSKHITGIIKYGITQWHRKTYGCCKKADLCIL